MTFSWLAAAAIALVAMLTNPAFRRRQIMRDVSGRVEGTDRLVDIGVIFKPVVADPHGLELIDGKPRMRVLEDKIIRKGGLVDTKANPPKIIGPSHNPRTWYVSLEQYDALFHADRSKLGQLIYGSEGAGKTRLLAMWHYLMWIANLGERREGGQTAPTERRLNFVREEMLQLYPRGWFRYRSADKQFLMCDGTRIQLVSTYRQSKSQGSPIQGFNWSWCGRDEAQDSTDVHEDIESRGRSAAVASDGTVLYWQMATATAKDDTEWRGLRDILLASGAWIKRNLSIFKSPFIGADFIAKKKTTMDPREFLRRFGDPITGEVGDLPPELAVYYGWIRSRNLTALPRIATDVTAAVLAGYNSYCRPGARLTLVGCHDPGSIYNTTIFQRLVMFGDIPTWIVVGEHQTSQTTARGHAKSLKEYIQNNFGLELTPTRTAPNPSSKVAIFVDPHGKGEAQTDYQSVYMAFQEEGLDVFSPSPMTARIKRSARIEMVNRLLGGSAALPDVPRLVIALDERGAPVAPKLVESFESLKKRPGDDNPEGGGRKDEADKTHAPAALAYGLWPFEQEAFTAHTVKVAIAEARRVR